MLKKVGRVIMTVILSLFFFILMMFLIFKFIPNGIFFVWAVAGSLFASVRLSMFIVHSKFKLRPRSF